MGGKFANVGQRREHLNMRYRDLRSLIPNPTKPDRASIVGDAIDYVSELLRTVNELKALAEKKRKGRKKRRTQTAVSEAPTVMESSLMRLLRDNREKSMQIFVDVRIIDDEVKIKLAHKKDNGLLYVRKALDELQLELIHLGRGKIGDHYIFMVDIKISEGSSVHAGAIAKKLLEVMDKQYPTPKL